MRRFLKICAATWVMALLLCSFSFCLAEEAKEADFAIQLTAESTEILAGEKVRITAAFANPDTVNKKAKNNKINWTVTDESGSETKLATVKDGVLTTQKKIEGRCAFIVTATANSMPSQTASVYISVIPAAEKLTLIAEDTVIFAQAGYNTVHLSTMVEPADAIQAVTWKSSDESVMTVDDNGTATALKNGRVTITATTTDGTKKSDQISFTIGDPVRSITLQDQSGMTLVSGGSIMLTATLEPADAADRSISWTLRAGNSQARDHLSISDSGRMSADADCPLTEVTVTATANGSLPGTVVSDSWMVYVIPSGILKDAESADEEDFVGRWTSAMMIAEDGSYGSIKLDLAIGRAGENLWFYILEMDEEGNETPVIGGKAWVANAVITYSLTDGDMNIGARRCKNGFIRCEVTVNDTHGNAYFYKSNRCPEGNQLKDFISGFTWRTLTGDSSMGMSAKWEGVSDIGLAPTQEESNAPTQVAASEEASTPAQAPIPGTEAADLIAKAEEAAAPGSVDAPTEPTQSGPGLAPLETAAPEEPEAQVAPDFQETPAITESPTEQPTAMAASLNNGLENLPADEFVTKVNRDAAGRVTDKEESTPDGKRLRVTYYNPDGSVSSLQVFSYGEDGLPSKVTYQNGSGQVTGWSEVDYSEDGTRTVSNYDALGIKTGWTEYDTNGIPSVSYDANGEKLQ